MMLLSPATGVRLQPLTPLHVRPYVQGFSPFPAGGDAFMTGFATDMLQQSGASYLQRGQAFMQQRMGFMSTDIMHYFFNLNTEYGEMHAAWSVRVFSAIHRIPLEPTCRADLSTRGCLWQHNHPSCDDTVTTAPFPLHAVRAKLLVLVAPFLRRWNYTRVLEQVCRGCNMCCIFILCCVIIVASPMATALRTALHRLRRSPRQWHLVEVFS